MKLVLVNRKLRKHKIWGYQSLQGVTKLLVFPLHTPASIHAPQFHTCMYLIVIPRCFIRPRSILFSRPSASARAFCGNFQSTSYLPDVTFSTSVPLVCAIRVCLLTLRLKDSVVHRAEKERAGSRA